MLRVGRLKVSEVFKHVEELNKCYRDLDVKIPLHSKYAVHDYVAKPEVIRYPDREGRDYISFCIQQDFSSVVANLSSRIDNLTIIEDLEKAFSAYKKFHSFFYSDYHATVLIYDLIE